MLILLSSALFVLLVAFLVVFFCLITAFGENAPSDDFASSDGW